MDKPINNCDGCQAGYPTDESGHHYIPKQAESGTSPWGRYMQICTAHLYKEKTEGDQ